MLENKSHKGDVHKSKKHKRHQSGAMTFRRGRAIAFLESMVLKRAILKKQLEMPELQLIQSILVGELKALYMVIDEFVQLFELYEFIEEKQNKGQMSSRLILIRVRKT